MKVLLTLLLLAQADAGTTDAGSPFQNPLLVTADRLQVQGKLKQAVYTGHVHAVRQTTKLQCDKLIAHYRTSEEINRLECMGNVQVFDGDKWARGERADFDNVANILVVTGHPEARQGRNYMKGDKIVFDVGKDTVEVERADTIIETRGGPPALPRSPHASDGGVAEPAKDAGRR
jgi:lipopolysaccharide export system protein LptA